MNADMQRWFLKSCPRCNGDVLYRLGELRCVTGCGWNGPTREDAPMTDRAITKSRWQKWRKKKAKEKREQMRKCG